MDYAAIVLAAATSIAQFHVTAPSVNAHVVNTPYGRLGCYQRARNVLYAIGGTNMQERENSIFAVVSGDTTAMVWCRGDHAVLFGAGPHANDAAQALRAGF